MCCVRAELLFIWAELVISWAELVFSTEKRHQHQIHRKPWCSLCPQHPWYPVGESVRSYGSCHHALIGLRLAVLSSRVSTCPKALSLLFATTGSQGSPVSHAAWKLVCTPHPPSIWWPA